MKSCTTNGGTRNTQTRGLVVRQLRALYAASIVLYLVSATAVAQLHQPTASNDEAIRPSLLLGGTYSSNFTRTSIDAYSGDILCGVFTSGNGGHFSLRAQYESPFGSAFGLLVGLSFRNLSSRYTTAPFNNERALYPTTGSPVTINRERIYDVSMNAIGPSIGASWHPLSRVSLGASMALYAVPNASYVQSEHLITGGVVYTDNLLSTRPVANGLLPTNHIASALELQAGYDLPVSSRMAARAYAEGVIGLTSLANVAGAPYRAYSVNGGVALVYTFPSENVERPVEPIIIPPPAPEPKATPPVATATPAPRPKPLRLEVRAVGLTDHDEEVSQPVVAIENVLVTDVSPMLGYVFFDDGSSNIPHRYHCYERASSTSSFSTKQFYSLNAEGINHELLNIIGKRLQDHPKATITLTGTRSIHSPLDSATSDTIAFARAQRVAEYLQSVWQIAPQRIRTRSRALPELSSDDNNESGQAENRRVEITSNSREILEPVETRKFEQTATPPRIMFHQDIYTSHGIASNKIIIRQGDRVLQTRDQLSGDTRSEWLWNITDGDALKSSDSVSWTMVVTDSIGETAEVSGIIRIKPQEHTTTTHAIDTSDADKSLERFHLLLFDYSSSSELGQNSESVLNRLAASVTPDAEITITGHTDITGDAAFNEKLSYQRASRAALLLGSKLRAMGRSIPSLQLEARGSKDLLFDNSVAEGRMLSRTVRVSIERNLK
ncbi:MAG: OmpA family protein [Bacteroidetes bacterium]|nr:OmpA family protein [Bacteroidota bacterium]